MFLIRSQNHFKVKKIKKTTPNAASHLLYFKLTFARPVERDITMPRESKEEYLVDFDGGDKGRTERAFKIAIIIQLHM